MSTIILSIIFSLVALCFLASIVVHFKQKKWMADIQTYDGRKKLRKLQYERLELARYRKKSLRKGNSSINNLQEVPLDAPLKKERNHGEPWKSINKISSFDFSRNLESDVQFDILRLYGIKDGKKYTVYNYTFYPENYDDIKTRVDIYNQNKSLPDNT